MNQILIPAPLSGTIRAIASKSQAHRLLIAAALADRPTALRCEQTSDDIDATVRCLNALGARIVRSDDGFAVEPIRAVQPDAVLDAGESGSTLRFLLPVVGALGAQGRFVLHGRLPSRPLSPLWENLEANGMTLRREPDGSLAFGGALHAGTVTLPGNVSSQFISGLLFALPLLPQESRIVLTSAPESAAYLTMTEQALAQFSVGCPADGQVYTVPGRQPYRSPGVCTVEGDWSNAAFALCAGALGGTGVTVTGLNPASAQGDRAIAGLLRAFGARVTQSGDSVTVQPGVLQGQTVDASGIPDLVPVLTAVAAAASGSTRVTHAQRLRIKESDRLKTVCALFGALGATIAETADGLCMTGGAPLYGGRVDACGDHRIAMTAAVASICCKEPVIVCGAEAVAKSYPAFWRDFAALGGRIKEENAKGAKAK